MRLKTNLLKIVKHQCNVDLEDYDLNEEEKIVYNLLPEPEKTEFITKINDKLLQQAIRDNDCVIERHEDEFCTLLSYNQDLLQFIMKSWKSNYDENIEEEYEEFWKDLKLKLKID